MFGNRRGHHHSDEHVARAQPTAPGGSSTVRPSHDLDEAAPLYTLPMPYDVAADHESVIVYVTESGPVTEFADIQTSCLERLAREASRRGCYAVYGLQQSMAATDGTVLISLLGTGSRPVPDLDRPADLPGT